MDNVRVISDFFNVSPKRQSPRRITKELLPQAKHKMFIDVCSTRWVLRLEGLQRFQEMFIPITEALLTFRDNEDHSWDSSSKAAAGLFSVCQDFGFIICPDLQLLN